MSSTPWTLTCRSKKSKNCSASTNPALWIWLNYPKPMKKPSSMPLKTCAMHDVPLAKHQCPLCGQLNRCAPADTGSFATPCWCKSQPFPPELLAQVESGQRNKSCICQTCVNNFHTQQVSQ